MAQKDAGVYGGGALYSNPGVIEGLRSSGLTTVIAWSVHVHENGDLIFNNPPIVSGGNYVGDPAWPRQMVSLKQAPTTIRRLIFSVGAAENPDFTNIQKLIREHGTGPQSILYRNFAALKKAIPGIDAIDFDDEDLMDADTTVEFALMLGRIGYKVTFCPWEDKDYWTDCLSRLDKSVPGLVTNFNLQCYAGGSRNQPGAWIQAVEKKMGPTFDAKSFVRPGLWSRHSEHDEDKSCNEGECPAAMRSKLAGWRSTGIDGAWIWLLDDVLKCERSGTCAGEPMNVPTYAKAIISGLG